MNLALCPSRCCFRPIRKCVCYACSFLFLFLITSFQVLSQPPAQSSAIIFPGSLGETTNSVVTDASGNTYFTGMFSGTTDFDPGAGVANLTSNGELDVFVLKLNASGAFVWARSFGSQDPELGATVQFDRLGNVYVTGNFSAPMDVDPGPGSFLLNNNGNTDAYLVKLDASGNFVWAKAWGNTGRDGGSRVQVDPNNNVYVAGTFSGTVTVGATRLVSAGGEDVFLAKLDAAGKFLWAGSIGGPGFETVDGLDVDALGNVYFGGIVVGTGDLDPGTGMFPVSAPAELEQGYIVKVNSSGHLLWAKTIATNDASRINKLKLDPAGNLYCLGGFKGTADLDPGMDNLTHTSQGDEDIFLLKLDSAGKLSRATVVGGPTQDFARGLFVDTSGQCYVAGTFSSTVDFDPGPASAPMTADNIGTFLLKLDAAGNYVYASQIEGTFVRLMTDLAAVGERVYVTGFFVESVVFNGTTYYTDGLAADGVIFVYKQSVALPITFLRFDARLHIQHAQLEWWTSNDKSVSHFKVERSFDGDHYVAIAQKHARKNGRINKYQYLDPDRLSGTVYYRIKAVAGDGSFAYSPVRTLTVKPVIWVKVYPNPAKGALVIATIGLNPKMGKITVGFYNRVGVLVRTCHVFPGTAQVIRLNGIAAGLYTLRMTASGFSYSTQVIIQ